MLLSQRFFCIVNIAFLFFTSCILDYDKSDYTQPSTIELSFNGDNDFKIMQVTDIHWTYKFPLSNTKSYNMIVEMTEAETPDLVVITGDFLTGDETNIPKEDIKIIGNIFASRKIPWVFLLGNHDRVALDSNETSAKEIVEYCSELPYCLTQANFLEEDRHGNFYLPVKQFNDSDAVGTNLYFLDSGYSGINQEQVDWYRETSNQSTMENGGDVIPALAFFHIPIPEFRTLKTAENCIGEDNEPVCDADVSTNGFYEQVLIQKDIQGIFVGHDHTNSYVLTTDEGISLCYGRCAKMYPVRIPGYKRGCKIIDVKSNGDFSIYDHLDGGSKIILKD